MQHSRISLSWLTPPPERLRLTSWLFLRLLALIYGIAFLSLAGQVAGLADPQGASEASLSGSLTRNVRIERW